VLVAGESAGPERRRRAVDRGHVARRRPTSRLALGLVLIGEFTVPASVVRQSLPQALPEVTSASSGHFERAHRTRAGATEPRLSCNSHRTPNQIQISHWKPSLIQLDRLSPSSQNGLREFGDSAKQNPLTLVCLHLSKSLMHDRQENTPSPDIAIRTSNIYYPRYWAVSID
jgi:hypothetical protein